MRTAADANRPAESEYVVLYGVPWETCEGILDALGEYHLRHTYDQGTLEMRRLLYGATWEDYLKLLDATPDLSLPHTYDEGTLEMVGPRKDHDQVRNDRAQRRLSFPEAGRPDAVREATCRNRRERRRPRVRRLGSEGEAEEACVMAPEYE